MAKGAQCYSPESLVFVVRHIILESFSKEAYLHQAPLSGSIAQKALRRLLFIQLILHSNKGRQTLRPALFHENLTNAWMGQGL
jgi:hypothetical protein